MSKLLLSNILKVLLILILPLQVSLGQDTLVIYGQRVITHQERLELKIQSRKLFVKKYVDALNSYVVNDDCLLPEFFIIPDFDQQYGSKFMLSSHGRFSLRKRIIDSLSNYSLLWCVMRSEDQRLREKYTGKSKRFYMDYSRIPFEQFSTYELVDLRLDELENNQLLSGNKKD